MSVYWMNDLRLTQRVRKLMLLAAEELPALPCPACLIVGPGIGHSNRARQHLAAALQLDHALLLDADALNLLADDAELLTLLQGAFCRHLVRRHILARPLACSSLIYATFSRIEPVRSKTWLR